MRVALAPSVKEAPHLPQNAASASDWAPHDRQTGARLPPQPLQNLASALCAVTECAAQSPSPRSPTSSKTR